MGDLIERLRQASTSCSFMALPNNAKTCADAAAEIERLSTEVGELLAKLERAEEELQSAEAEMEAALDVIDRLNTEITSLKAARLADTLRYLPDVKQAFDDVERLTAECSYLRSILKREYGREVGEIHIPRPRTRDSGRRKTCTGLHDFRSKGDGTAKCRDCGELCDVSETGAAETADSSQGCEYCAGGGMDARICGVEAQSEDNVWACTRPPQHTGDHVACGAHHNVARWHQPAANQRLCPDSPNGQHLFVCSSGFPGFHDEPLQAVCKYCPARPADASGHDHEGGTA